MTKLEKIANVALQEATDLVIILKQSVDAANDNDKLFMAHLCARKAQIELDSCMRYLKEASKPAVGRR